MNEEFQVVLFFSTSAAIRAETLARRTGLEVKLVPVPRHLSSDCGVALRFPTAGRGPIKTMLEDNGVEYDRVGTL